MTEKQKKLQGWVSVFRTTTDYEADMARDRLDSAGIPAAVFTQRDHSFNLTVGSLARVYVMVPAESVDEAKAVLQEQITDEELLSAAAAAAARKPDNDPDPDSPDVDKEELLDSGIEKIHFDTLEDSREDDKLA